MFKSIAITVVHVLDQDEALAFYVDKLGFVVKDDVDMGFMRWLTITLPSDPGRELLLEAPREPQVRDLVTKGALGVAAILTTDDCEAVYETLKSRGVEFTQEVTKQPYGIDCAFRDPFGNHIRVTQPVDGPVEVTPEDIARWNSQ